MANTILTCSIRLRSTVEAFLFLVLHLEPGKLGIDGNLVKVLDARGTRLGLLPLHFLLRRILGRLCQHGLIHGKLDRIRFGSRPQIVHARLQPLLPRVKVHARQFAGAGLADVHVHALALTDEGAAIGGLVDDGTLGDLPHSFVDIAEQLRDFRYALDGATIGNDLVADASRPESRGSEVTEEVLIDNGEFSGEDTGRHWSKGV